MPEPLAQPILYFQGNAENAEIANQIVHELGFHLTEQDGSVLHQDEYSMYFYEFFEMRQKNINLLHECVDRLKEQFADREVWLENVPNKDYGKQTSENYNFYIASERDFFKPDRQSIPKKYQDRWERYSDQWEGHPDTIDWRKHGRNFGPSEDDSSIVEETTIAEVGNVTIIDRGYEDEDICVVIDDTKVDQIIALDHYEIIAPEMSDDFQEAVEIARNWYDNGRSHKGR